MLNELFGKFDQIAKVKGSLPPQLQTPHSGEPVPREFLTYKIPVPHQNPCGLPDTPLKVGNPCKHPIYHIPQIWKGLSIAPQMPQPQHPKYAQNPNTVVSGYHNQI